MLKSLLWTSLIAAVLVTNAAAQELTVVSSDQTGIVLEYRPVVTLEDFGSNGVRYDFAHAVGGDISLAGAPDLRFRRELLALPAEVGNTVEILQVDYRDETSVDVLPIADMRTTENGLREIFRRGGDYNTDDFLPAAAVRFENVGRSRGHILGDIVLTPVRWNPATRTARIHTLIRFRISYGPARSDLVAGMAPDVDILNPAMAARWIVPSRASLSRATASQTMASGNWYRFDVSQTGVYRLSRRWFADAGLDPGSIDPRTIRLFANGGRERPENLSADRPDPLQEIAIEVVGGKTAASTKTISCNSTGRVSPRFRGIRTARGTNTTSIASTM